MIQNTVEKGKIGKHQKKKRKTKVCEKVFTQREWSIDEKHRQVLLHMVLGQMDRCDVPAHPPLTMIE